MRPSAAVLALALLAPAAAHAVPDPLAGLPYLENPTTLSAVAARFHLSVDEIARLNGIKDKNRFHRHGLVLPDVPSTRSLPRYVPWAPAPPRATCAVKPWRLVAAKERGCTEAFCGAGPGGGRACVCRDALSGTTITVTTNGKSVRLPVEISAFNPWGSDLVEVASADLDGDGSPEVLLSTLWAVSNGLGQEYRELVVVRDGKELLRYDSGEFTAKTALVRVGDVCHLASSHWEEATHPLKGTALYLVERTFDPSTLRADRGLVGCRAGEAGRYELPFDPLAPAALPTRSGTLVAVSQADHAAKVALRTASGKSVLGEVRFGDARAQRVLPMNLIPGVLPAGKVLFGRSHETDVIWLSGTSRR
jgi:hypothetical protein